MKKKLIKLLSYLEDNQSLLLGDDTFLIGELDGSDKLYGFINEGGEIKVITRQCSDGYPISDMDKEDLNYIFKLSAPNIAEKIKNKKYELEYA